MPVYGLVVTTNLTKTPDPLVSVQSVASHRGCANLTFRATVFHRRFRTNCGRFINPAKQSAQIQPLETGNAGSVGAGFFGAQI